MASTKIKTRRIRFKTLVGQVQDCVGDGGSLALAAIVARYSRRYDERPVQTELRRAMRNYLDYATQPKTPDDTDERARELLWELEDRAGHVWDFSLHWKNQPTSRVMTWRGYVPRSRADHPIPTDEAMVLVLGVAALNEAGAKSNADACRLMGCVMRVAKIRKGRAKDESLRADESAARRLLWGVLEAIDWTATVKAYEREGRKLLKTNPWVLVPD